MVLKRFQSVKLVKEKIKLSVCLSALGTWRKGCMAPFIPNFGFIMTWSASRPFRLNPGENSVVPFE